MQAKQYTAQNYQRLLSLARDTEDNRIGDMIEAFIAAAPNLDFFDNAPT